MILKHMPTTKQGKRAFCFALGTVGFYLLSIMIVALSQKQINDETVISVVAQPYLMVSGLLAIICGIIAFFIGLISYFKYQERSPFIYPVLLVGLMMILFLLGEFFFPH